MPDHNLFFIMFDPHRIQQKNSNYYSKKGQIIQQKDVNREIFNNIEEIKKARLYSIYIVEFRKII